MNPSAAAPAPNRRKAPFFATLLLALAAFMLVGCFTTARAQSTTGSRNADRVKTAFDEKESGVRQTLDAAAIRTDTLNILLVAFKSEGVLELWAKNSGDARYQRLQQYPICAKSGDLGPKKRAGDYQVPEGFYHIDRFNPKSQYHLSLGINYPNAIDKTRGKVQNRGGDIFIHGKCVTIGCLPMGDAQISEIYVYATLARRAGQKKIPVYIFPFRMTDENMQKHIAPATGKDLKTFWQNIRTGYTRFISTRAELQFSAAQNGLYRFAP